MKNPQPFLKVILEKQKMEVESISVPSYKQIWVFLSAFTIGHCAIALKKKKDVRRVKDY